MNRLEEEKLRKEQEKLEELIRTSSKIKGETAAPPAAPKPLAELPKEMSESQQLLLEEQMWKEQRKKEDEEWKRKRELEEQKWKQERQEKFSSLRPSRQKSEPPREVQMH